MSKSLNGELVTSIIQVDEQQTMAQPQKLKTTALSYTVIVHNSHLQKTQPSLVFGIGVNCFHLTTPNISRESAGKKVTEVYL